MNFHPPGGAETPPTGVLGFAWYNMQPYHMMAITLNMIDNAAAQALVAPDVYVANFYFLNASNFQK